MQIKEIKQLKGLKLCEGFFNDCARAILDESFPELRYSAGLIGYGSDVLGYDDAVSTDHMWGPRFYLFYPKMICQKRMTSFRYYPKSSPIHTRVTA